MNAQIFCLKSQRKATDRIEALLRRHVFPEIGVDRLEISDDYNTHSDENEHKYCRRFLRLFKASIVKVDDFAIVVADGKGRWYYMGGSYKDEPYLLELFNKSMPSVFPAVAIMDRMVMMPRNVGEAFEKSRAFSWFVKPRDLEGMVLADFQHADSVDEGMRQIGLQLRSDIAKLCRRHMLVRKIETPDFVELGQLLGLDTQYLELHRGEIVAPFARLSSRIVSGAAKIRMPSRVVLEIRYDSQEPLGKVCVRVNAPGGTLVKPVMAAFSFPGGKSDPQQIQFDVAPRTTPYCPLEVFFSMDEAQPVAAPFPIPLILDVQS